MTIGFKKNKINTALRVTFIYVIVGILFIIAFPNAMLFFTKDKSMLMQDMMYFVSLGVIITAVILYYLIWDEDRKSELANKKLLDTEKRYFLIFNISSVVKILLNTKDFTILDANEAAYSFLGIPREKLISKNFKSIFREEESYELIKNYIEFHSTNGSLTVKFITPQNEEKYIEIFLDYIDSFGSNLVYLVIHDVTEKVGLERQNEEYKKNLEKLIRQRTADLRKSNLLLERENKRITVAEQRIENQLNYFKTIIETIPFPLFIKAIDGKYLEVNKAFLDYFKMKKIDVISKNVFSILPEEAAQKSMSFDGEVISSVQTSRREVYYTDNEGVEHFLQYLRAPLLKTDGSVDGIIGLINDLTEYKKLQNELKLALEKEQEISNLKSRFISMASHEFRTPLTTILASADLLEMFGRKWSDEKFNEHTGKIRKKVRNMVELLDDVLVISRADTGKLNYNPANMDLFNFCCEVVDTIRNNKNDSQEIIFEYLDDRKIVNADVKLLGHVFNNLLSNAVKYSPEGGEILFRVRFDDINKSVVFLVKDNGIGMSPEFKKMLFEPFQRGENIGAIQGTGLGLSIAKRAIDLHNGTVICESEEGKGTTFMVSLPILPTD